MNFLQGFDGILSGGRGWGGVWAGRSGCMDKYKSTFQDLHGHYMCRHWSGLHLSWSLITVILIAINRTLTNWLKATKLLNYEIVVYSNGGPHIVSSLNHATKALPFSCVSIHCHTPLPPPRKKAFSKGQTHSNTDSSQHIHACNGAGRAVSPPLQ